MYITILGRQPILGITELERIYGAAKVKWFSDMSATVDTSAFNFDRLGGSQKAGKITLRVHGSWQTVSKKILTHYSQQWQHVPHKITLGISAYGFHNLSPREVQKTGIQIKQQLKRSSVSIRLVPNSEPALNTAASHHNRLGLSQNKIELLVIRARDGNIIVAESIGAQNISAFAARDQARPKTDAFVGMLPPKLARIMINMAVGQPTPEKPLTILDAFCGTGVILQEAILLGYNVHGTDLSEKMVDYSRANLDWLTQKYPQTSSQTVKIELGDAMTHAWTGDIHAVVSEAYLGQPFSAPPRPEKLEEVRRNCNHIISSFLENIHRQIAVGTQICLAVPAWHDDLGRATRLPLTHHVQELGYRYIADNPVPLIYRRESQVVGRDILLLRRV